MQLSRRLALGALLVLTVAGCGGTDGGDDRVATAGGNGGTATASPTTEALTDEERQMKFSQCMREQGVDIPDPEINGGGVKLRIPPGGEIDKQKVQAGLEKCQQYLPNGGVRKQLNPEQAEQMRKLAQCMREHGVPEFPDPDPNGGIRIQAGPGSKLNPDDPTFKAAQEACAQYRPDGLRPSGSTTNKEQG